MAYDETLAEKVRTLLKSKKGFTEKKMFGGICFLLDGNMCGGVLKNELIVRVDPQQYENLKTRPNTREFDFTGRPMKGWIVVTAPGHQAPSDLKAWVDRGVQYAGSLPAKKKRPAKGAGKS